MKTHSSKHPLVSIITVNFNRLQDTSELLSSLENIQYPNTEIILVDNGSKEDPSILQSKFPKLKILLNSENLGFAAANNLGIKNAKGKYLFLVNNDVIVTPDFLQPLVNKLENNNDIGIVSPKIYYHSKPQMIQYAGFTDIHPITIRNQGIGFNENEKGQYDEEKATFYAHGAAFLFRNQLIIEVGFLSERFFLYYEEMDWCKQVRNHNYQIYYIPKSIVYHKDSVTTGSDSPLKTYYLSRGRLIYMLRNVKFPLLIISSLYQILFAFPKNYLAFILRNERLQAKAYREAYAWFLWNFFNKKIRTDEGNI